MSRTRALTLVALGLAAAVYGAQLLYAYDRPSGGGVPVLPSLLLLGGAIAFGLGARLFRSDPPSRLVTPTAGPSGDDLAEPELSRHNDRRVGQPKRSTKSRVVATRRIPRRSR